MYKKTYRLEIVYRLLDAILYAIFFSFVMPVVWFFTNDWLLAILISLVGLCGLGFWLVSRHRVVVSDYGIEYYKHIYSIETSWDNVESFRKIAGFGNPTWGLWLRLPVLKIHPWLLWYIDRTNKLSPAGEDVDKFIPIQPFGGINWQNSALMNDVRRYLPHLFTEKANTKELGD